ncbi:serine hydrolase [Streptomyces sp. NPDC058316]|uniref:serine hydrolase n=1 Tax=unclassified Streptomyces TaxID=2593676 RepID=UPI0036E43BC6
MSCAGRGSRRDDHPGTPPPGLPPGPAGRAPAQRHRDRPLRVLGGRRVVSTNSGLSAFFSALLGGRLLEKAQLDQMRPTVLMGKDGYNAGLGIISTPLSCERVAWAHSGAIPGYRTWAAATDDGRAAAVTMTLEPTSDSAVEHLEAAVDAALCR